MYSEICSQIIKVIYLRLYKGYFVMDVEKDTTVTYRYLCFDHSEFKKKIFNGSPQKMKRCRFCGKVLDSSHYTKEAHAISVSLGNTKLFCADECDDCNAWFGRYLESDVVNYFQMLLSLDCVPKRNGDERVVSGRNFDMKMSKENQFFPELPLLKLRMRDWKDGEPPFMKGNTVKILMDLSNKTFVPQNVYKAFCKYALSLMPHSLTTRFQQTIDWIKGNKIVTELPLLKIAVINRESTEPFMKLLFRETDDASFPFCVVSLIIASCHIMYAIPFCDEGVGEVDTKIQFKQFWSTFVEGAEGMEQFVDSDFSNPNRVGIQSSIQMQIEKGAIMYKLCKDNGDDAYTCEAVVM